MNSFLYSQEEAGVEAIQALHINGQTFVTFQKRTNDKINYMIYRFSEKPAEIGESRPIAKISSNSYMHPDSFTKFVMPDGKQLTEKDGLFVYTAKTVQNVYYAVMVEGKKESLRFGKNIIAEPVQEGECKSLTPVFQAQNINGNQIEDYYALWMDYDQWEMFTNPGNWPKAENEYYASFFSISYFKEISLEKKPAVVSLHGMSGGGNGGYYALDAIQGTYQIYVSDHRKRWWKGSTEARINLQIDYLINSDKYNVDKERVYLDGSSMGGYGAIYHAIKYGPKYAAVSAFVPIMNQEDISVINTTTLLPPILSYFGYRESDFSDQMIGRKGHIPYIKKMQDSLQGVWVLWYDIGHTIPKNVNHEKVVSGGLLRFRRNELYPVFLNTSTDENCGQKTGQVPSFSGQINQKIDWASSLHPLNIKNSDLVDTADEIKITFKSTELLTADICLRRIQNFKLHENMIISYQVTDVFKNTVVLEGELSVPNNQLLLIKNVPISFMGSTLRIIAKE